jgi:hypothetical protein
MLQSTEEQTALSTGFQMPSRACITPFVIAPSILLRLKVPPAAKARVTQDFHFQQQIKRGSYLWQLAHHNHILLQLLLKLKVSPANAIGEISWLKTQESSPHQSAL